MRALGSAQGALDALAALLPDDGRTRHRRRAREPSASPSSAPATPSWSAPAAACRPTATVSGGQAEFDESMITGESKTVLRAPGDPVVAGTIATDNSVRVRVTAIGEDTALAGIRRLVAEAQASSSRAQALADRAAALPLLLRRRHRRPDLHLLDPDGQPTRRGDPHRDGPGHRLPPRPGLAIPLVIAISTERAARAGVLIKNRMALERMRTVDVVLFDKTGTLTRGEPELKEVAAADAGRPAKTLRRIRCWHSRPPWRLTANIPWPARSLPRPGNGDWSSRRRTGSRR